MLIYFLAFVAICFKIIGKVVDYVKHSNECHTYK